MSGTTVNFSSAQLMVLLSVGTAGAGYFDGYIDDYASQRRSPLHQ